MELTYNFRYVPYSETGYFSRLVTDYLSDLDSINQFYGFAPNAKGLAEAIEQRKKYPVNREVLVSVLNKQYAELNTSDATQENIQRLLSENTYTVCTAHQPNLLTGYLYFVYKILHAIKLAEELSAKYPETHFVPVYYMGSEDNDIEELGTFRFRGDKYAWDGDGQRGAVGRMSTAGLKKTLAQLFKYFGPPGKDCVDLQEILVNAYQKHKTIGAGTQYLVNELFGRYGLVVIDPDETELKRLFVPVMEDELLNSNSSSIIGAQIEKLGATYKIQAQPREINLFYLTDQLRERIERHGDMWMVINTEIKWNKEEMLAELKEHPERFSPNVMLRGLFQETILPDVAFIGGGAEVAYWLQLKTVFAHYDVYYPTILLRQSVLWMRPQAVQLQTQLEMQSKDIFKSSGDLLAAHVAAHTNDEWRTEKETEAISEIFEQLKQKATSLDSTLTRSAEAALQKMTHQLEILQKKMLRAEKKKMAIPASRIQRMKELLFPNNSLQERVENFSEYYLEYGSAFFDTILEGIEPLGNHFLIIEEEQSKQA